MRRRLFTGAVRLALLLTAVGAVQLFAANGGGALAQRDQGDQRLCDIPGGSITVTYTPEHPYRVGTIEVDEKCTVTQTYEDLTAEEFAALSQEKDGKEETAAPLAQNLSSEGAVNATATVYTKKVKGRQVLCHDVGVSCVDMVEVSSQERWWYDYSRVTSYGEGLGRRWAGSCWDFDGSFSVWWRTEYMPSRIGISAYSGFKTAWYCPWFPGGWLRTTTWGWYNGSYAVTCEHSDLKGFPPPTRVKCWTELI